jgi:hypothetical protein
MAYFSIRATPGRLIKMLRNFATGGQPLRQKQVGLRHAATRGDPARKTVRAVLGGNGQMMN